MILAADVVTVEICSVEEWRVTKRAVASELGGRSAVRGEGRMESLAEDQRVGHIGAYCGTKLLFGDPAKYFEQRDIQDRDPWKGDGGSDIVRGNVDFKSSLMRGSGSPMSYRLPVRPEEMHDGMVYVLVLVEREVVFGRRKVHVVGWATPKMFGPPEKDGVFKGAHVLPAVKLNPVIPFRWGPDAR